MIRLKHLWTELRSSFWFVPLLIIATCAGAAVLLIHVDTDANDAWLARWPRLFGAGAAGARSMISTIASSMMSAVGVTFSMTLVALALASSQYTPRILRNFMRSRATQVVLGLLTGTFAYCVIVLRTIRGGEEGAFVPTAAVFGSMVLALAGSALLVFFIHHVASSIQASQIIASVAEETIETIDSLFPQEVGHGRAEHEDACHLPEGTWQVIIAEVSGFVQSVDSDSLLRLAIEHGVVIRMERAVGEFIVAGTAVATALHTDGIGAAMRDVVRRAFTISRFRTVEQDPGFGIRQLVDIALKALSPGINDTTTAVTCVDYLTVVLARLASRRTPPPNRFAAGQLRIIARATTFEGLLDEAIAQIRDCASGNVAVHVHLVGGISTLEGLTSEPGRRRALLAQLVWIGEKVGRIDAVHERARLTSLIDGVRTRLEAEPRAHAIALGGASSKAT